MRRGATFISCAAASPRRRFGCYKHDYLFPPCTSLKLFCQRAAVKVARLSLSFLEPLAGWPTCGSSIPSHTPCHPQRTRTLLGDFYPAPYGRYYLFLRRSYGSAARCVRPVVTGCDRAGPRAPARQMVVRLILCPCLEGAGTREPAKTRFPQKPQFGVTASLLHSVQYILLPTHPPPNPRIPH